jgi:Xaa-Pro aminopeptidase
MNVTNEPGYYETGAYGIRIEDLMFVVPSESNPNFLGFQNVTLVPYDRNLIDLSVLTKAQVEFVNEYHVRVYSKVAPLLESQGRTEVV